MNKNFLKISTLFSFLIITLSILYSNFLTSKEAIGQVCFPVSYTGLEGTGTANSIPRWLNSNTLGNSIIYQKDNKIGIGTTSPRSLLDVAGDLRISQPSYSLILGSERGDNYGWWSPWLHRLWDSPPPPPPPVDTCNGDITRPYTCSPNDVKTCVDVARMFGVLVVPRPMEYYMQRNVTCVLDTPIYKIHNSLGTLQFVDVRNNPNLVITQDGLVGIGTTTPARKLDVVGGYVRSDTGFCIGSSCITSWPEGYTCLDVWSCTIPIASSGNYLVTAYFHAEGRLGTAENNWATLNLIVNNVSCDSYTSNLGIYGASNTLFGRCVVYLNSGNNFFQISTSQGPRAIISRPAIIITKLDSGRW